MKWVQYDRALTSGLSLITWTVDPLEAPNAILNFRKLGGICQTYFENLYGDQFSRLGKGMPSDRFQVEWWLDQGRVSRLRRGESTVPIPPSGPFANPTSGDSTFRHITKLDLDLDSPHVVVEIPSDIQTLRQTNLPLALEWRMKTRQVFQSYFSRGYFVSDGFLTWEENSRRVFYTLKR